MNSAIQSVDLTLCTWNRAALLRRTLASIAALEVPAGVGLKLILVDNHSTDSTPQVIEEFAASPFAGRHQFQPVCETRRGHTPSRNRALEESTGDLVLWTDDDVQVAPDWLKRYVQAAGEQPQVDFWGSVIQPEFEGGCPRWIEANWETLKGCFAARDLGPEPIELTADRLPYGANFAIRGAVQRSHRFDESLGRRGQEVLGEDELDLMRRLLAAGRTGRWIPGAVVSHWIPRSRASVSYVYDYFVGQGRVLVQRGTPWHKDRQALQAEARSEYRRFRWQRWCRRSPVWCGHLVRAALADGQARALSQP